MAVIDCPNCNKKISDKAKACSHCEMDLTDLDADKIKRLAGMNRIKKQQQLMNHSFAAMLLFCGGFLFLYWQDAEMGSWQYTASIASSVIGFSFYIITRVRILLNKKSSQ